MSLTALILLAVVAYMLSSHLRPGGRGGGCCGGHGSNTGTHEGGDPSGN
jgi:hypothetical protein